MIDLATKLSLPEQFEVNNELSFLIILYLLLIEGVKSTIRLVLYIFEFSILKFLIKSKKDLSNRVLS